MDDFVANISPEIFTRAHPGREFFLARQPILDRDQELIAYELLFRSAAAGPANVTDDVAATATVIAHASELGMENVIGVSRAFINVDAVVLMSDFIQFLPRERVVLEILETVKVTDRLVGRVQELVREGYIFALDDVVADSDGVQKLLPLVEVIKVDIKGVEQGDLSRLSARFKQAEKKLLAEKVENLAQFQICLDLGFDYFQGYYFAKPLVLTGKKLSPSQMTIMRLMAQIISNADNAELERNIKRDASLGLMLLRLANAAEGQRIDSLGQALTVLGRAQLQRWLQILLYAEFGKPRGVVSPLFVLATTRGKLLELMAEKIRPGDQAMADTAFTVGIMSLMDALFGLPMEKALARLHVADQVKDALLWRSGVFGDMLILVECIEHIEESGEQAHALLQKLQLSSEDLYELQLAAFEWSNAISHSAN
ncbi:EAL domain-containing protein [Herbaspirillum sp. ST 5-3]|uniref:EAL and HDOD domain-containing protein n=1 Tax=Oxalobacteraceae TaxID=75682 RepID=UPI0010A3CB32|nr:EAL domain-containing protein [Herbaspirillum sp. ST 5-3]